MPRWRLGLLPLLLVLSDQALAAESLGEAALRGDQAAVRSILDSGVGVEERDQALFVASKAGRTEVVSLLLAHWADANFVMPAGTCCTGWSPLLIAAAEGHTSTVEALLKAGASVGIRNGYGRTALHFVASYGYNDIVRLLLDHGADVNDRPADGIGATALCQAAGRGHGDTVDLLLQYGADVNAATDDGTTCLMLAAREGHGAIVDRLLIHGADAGASSEGISVLASTIQLGHDDISKRLLSAGANPNGLCPGPHKSTYSVLLLSVLFERDAVVEALLERGAAVAFRSSDGLCARDLAERTGNRRIIRLLKEAEASGRQHESP